MTSDIVLDDDVGWSCENLSARSEISEAEVEYIGDSRMALVQLRRPM